MAWKLRSLLVLGAAICCLAACDDPSSQTRDSGIHAGDSSVQTGDSGIEGADSRIGDRDDGGGGGPRPFIWGTEAYVKIENASSISQEVQGYVSVVRDTLKVDFVKIRLSRPHNFDPSDPEATKIDIPDLNEKYDLDEVAKLFKAQKWSMVPMLSTGLGMRDISSDKQVADYVDFVDWFVGRYKEDANIQYVELVNAPFQSQRETEDKYLLALNNATYDRIKSKYPEIMMGTPGFEYFEDGEGAHSRLQVRQVEYFLANDAKFDFWAFHGYGGGIFPNSEYPPTKSCRLYCGISGIQKIRKAMDANGWQDRGMIDTEFVPLGKRGIATPENDKLSAAYLTQDLLLKRTLHLNNRRVLDGVLPLKIVRRCSNPETDRGDCHWASLYADGSLTHTVRAAALLWAKIDGYSYGKHISGELDNESEIWIEKFRADGRELYVFFKPFEYHQGRELAFDGGKLGYELTLERMPTEVILTDMYGAPTRLSAAQKVRLEATNAPSFLEVLYTQ